MGKTVYSTSTIIATIAFLVAFLSSGQEGVFGSESNGAVPSVQRDLEKTACETETAEDVCKPGQECVKNKDGDKYCKTPCDKKKDCKSNQVCKKNKENGKKYCKKSKKSCESDGECEAPKKCKDGKCKKPKNSRK